MRQFLLRSGVFATAAGAVLWVAGVASEARASTWGDGPPVHFAVARGDGSIFYPTRQLRYGDRFEVKAHKLSDYNVLIVVPCHPDCLRPDAMYAYPLSVGNHQLQLPTTGHYMFWLERDHIGGEGIAWRFGVVRSPLKVLDYKVSDDNFSGTFEGGAELSVRTLMRHETSVVDSTEPPELKPLLISRPTYTAARN
jgi:hypothetical protein